MSAAFSLQKHWISRSRKLALVGTGTVLVLATSALTHSNAQAQARDAGGPGVVRDASVAAAAVPATPTPATPAVVAPVVSPFEGTWRYSGGAAQQQAMDQAIQRTVQGMGFIIEGMALGRLRDRNPLTPVITIHVANGQLEYTAHARRTYRTALDGTALRTQNPWGEDISLTTRIAGNVLTRVANTSQGARTDVIRVNGNTLTLNTTVTSPRLPRALNYTLTYQR